VIDAADSWAQLMEGEGVISKFVPIDFSDAEHVFDHCLEVEGGTGGRDWGGEGWRRGRPPGVIRRLPRGRGVPTPAHQPRARAPRDHAPPTALLPPAAPRAARPGRPSSRRPRRSAASTASRPSARWRCRWSHASRRSWACPATRPKRSTRRATRCARACGCDVGGDGRAVAPRRRWQRPGLLGGGRGGTVDVQLHQLWPLFLEP
jgi:hypothetical protein